MGLPRFILLAIIIGGGMWLWRRFKSRPINPPANTDTKTMGRCAHCHVHLPQDRAIKKNQQWYCSTEHLEQGPQTRD